MAKIKLHLFSSCLNIASTGVFFESNLKSLLILVLAILMISSLAAEKKIFLKTIIPSRKATKIYIIKSAKTKTKGKRKEN